MTERDSRDKGGISRSIPQFRSGGMGGRDERDTPLKGGYPIYPDPNPSRLSDRLSDLAHRVRRLAPSHRDPERYHVEKSEIESELRLLARHAAR
jgi:hypothetical protein